MTNHRPAHPAALLLTTIVLGAALLLLAPVQIGGQTAYVIVSGNSMEPLYARGDLVILRIAEEYGIGDIVTYRHPQIGPVIHRIIGREDGRWIFKGDHNSFIDTYRPTDAELIGRAVLHAPRVGTFLTVLRAPLPLAALTAVVLVVAAAGAQRGTRRRKGGQAAPAAGSGPSVGTLALTLLGLASLALGGLAFTRSESTTSTTEITFDHAGRFSYAAAATPGLYDTRQAPTGQPIFRKLASTVAVQFQYSLRAEDAADVGGSYRLQAELRAGNGWSRTVELQPEQAFSGTTFTTTADLDLARLQSMIDTLERDTGYEQQQYLLAIAPTVRVRGTLQGEPMRATFAPRLLFRMDKIQLEPLRDDGKEGDPFAPTEGGLLKRSVRETNTIALPGLRLDVAAARAVALGGLALALVGALVVYGPAAWSAHRNAVARIQLQHGSLIIDVESDGAVPADSVPVRQMADLARMAEKRGAMILHSVHGAEHCYILSDEQHTFVHTVEATAEPAPVAQPAPAAEAASPAPMAGAGTWQAAFLERLRETGLTTEACRVAGVGIVAAYREREHVPAFDRAWREAQQAAHARADEKERKL